MLHFLLIILALLGIWKLLAHGNSSPESASRILLGLRRLALVLACAGAALGGLIGYAANERAVHPGFVVLGAVLGFGVTWLASRVILWIINGFLPAK
jgi:hypothetical protein